MDSVRIVHRQEITPEQACDARVRALRFVFDCHAKKRGSAEHTAPDDAEGRFRDGFHAYKASVPR